MVKVMSRTVTCDVCCQVAFVDIEGLSDGKSIKNILDKIEPRKLVWGMFELFCT